MSSSALALVDAEFVALFLLQLSDLMSNLPPQVREVVQSAPPLDSAVGAGLYGSGSLLGGYGLKKLIGRLRSTTPSTSTSAAGTVVTTAGGGTPESIKHDETAFTLPGFLPLSKGIRKVSHNEIHAIEIGLVVGFVTVWLYSIGRKKVAAGLTIALVAGGLGIKRYGSKAVATVRMEPWYAYLAFALGGGGAYAYFIA